MNRILFISFTIALLFISCAEQAEITIDNPTDTAVSVSIDGKEAFEVPPFTYLNLPKLEVSGHLMRVNGGKSHPIFVKKPAVMLNPTLSTYVVIEAKYGDSYAIGIIISSEYKGDNVIRIDSLEYAGPFKLIDRKYCINLDAINLDVETDFPEAVKVSG